MMRLGIFGGTFDPPHIGHLILAAELSHVMTLDAVYWVLTPQPPHKLKKDITPVSLRKEMLQITLDGNEKFHLSSVDLDRPPPHFAADTVQIFRENFPDDKLVYLIGEDSLRDLPNWERPEQFLRAVDTVGVLSRPCVEADLDALDRELPGVGHKVTLVSKPLLQISSTAIRYRAKEGQPYRYFLHPEVYKLIENNALYRD